MQRLKLIITFNQDLQGVESTSDMTQFSQNINKNTQKKQNSLRQLRFWQFTFHSSLFSTWHWQLSLTKQAEKRSRNRAKKRHQTTINKQLRPTVKSVSCWESANQLQRMSGRLSQSILVILFQKCISGPLSLVELNNFKQVFVEIWSTGNEEQRKRCVTTQRRRISERPSFRNSRKGRGSGMTYVYTASQNSITIFSFKTDGLFTDCLVIVSFKNCN